MNKKRIVVICPGRGTYTRETIKYLTDCNKESAPLIKWMDQKRQADGRLSLTDLDSSPFKSKTHMLGENASSLIYACSIKDFLAIITPGEPRAYVLCPENNNASISIFLSSKPLI